MHNVLPGRGIKSIRYNEPVNHTIIRISLVMLLGVVTSVAVAWACAWRMAALCSGPRMADTGLLCQAALLDQYLASNAAGER